MDASSDIREFLHGTRRRRGLGGHDRHRRTRKPAQQRQLASSEARRDTRTARATRRRPPGPTAHPPAPAPEGGSRAPSAPVSSNRRHHTRGTTAGASLPAGPPRISPRARSAAPVSCSTPGDPFCSPRIAPVAASSGDACPAVDAGFLVCEPFGRTPARCSGACASTGMLRIRLVW
jgi:hypothetical protein